MIYIIAGTFYIVFSIFFLKSCIKHATLYPDSDENYFLIDKQNHN
jgi:hypothetical protein